MRVGNISHRRGHVLALVGAQYGSEGKGKIVNFLANDYGVHVRTGGPNAGHSFWHQGTKHVMQVLPCGWTNPNAALVLGRGMLVDVVQLIKEIEYVSKYDPNIADRIFVDASAAVLDPHHYEEEGGVHGEMHARIGSTGKGVGAARLARVARDPSRIRLFGDAAKNSQLLQAICKYDTPRFIRDALNGGDSVLLEGTQGSGLSLVHGPWPYVTSQDTNAAQLAADAGVAPRFVSRTMLVARTYPIRVAGNSGPLQREITWETLSQRVGKPVQETTTVTKKVRRVGEWDWDLFDRAVELNAPTSIALTFADYLDPGNEGAIDYNDLDHDTREFVRQVELRSGADVVLIGTGDEAEKIIKRDRGV
jgi:adenylosuccinate synthase